MTYNKKEDSSKFSAKPKDKNKKDKKDKKGEKSKRDKKRR